jgi:VCBS repeat-containing protein
VPPTASEDFGFISGAAQDFAPQGAQPADAEGRPRLKPGWCVHALGDIMTVIIGNSASNTLTGSSGSDLIDGGAGNDVIDAGGGTNLVDGGSGNDTITTGDGTDLIDGGAGNDVIDAGGGTNLVDGGSGNDTITTGDGTDLIDGGAGNDIIDAGGGTNVVAGGSGNDTITTGDGADLIDGGAGNDVIDSGGGFDLVLAGSGDDSVAYTRLAGSDGYALYVGEAGRDTLLLTVTRAEYDANAVLRAEIAAYQAFLAGGAPHGGFTFTFGDGQARLTAAQFERFELVLTGVSNTPPVANADTGSADENETRSFDVLANDTDADAGDSKSLDALGPVTVTSPNGSINGVDASGAFTIVGNEIQFVPGTLFDALAVGETATVVVAYTMSDGQGATSSATLTLTITGSNDAPVITGAVVAAMDEEDAAATVVALLANASDPDSGANLDVDGLNYVVTGGTWPQTVLYNLDADTGLLELDPAQFDGLGEGETIELTFSYSVIDGNGGNTSGSAVVTVTGAADAPVIAVGNDSGTVAEDGLLVTNGDLDATDPDLGDTADWTAGPAAYGAASVDPATGEWTYTLDNAAAAVQGLGQGDVLTDGFDVTVTDGDGLSDTRTVAITITGSGDDPVIAAGNDTGSVVEDGLLTATGDLDVGDVDSGDTAAWTAGSAAYGLVSIDQQTGAWTYTLDNTLDAVQDLDEGVILQDSFVVTVTDSDGLVDTRTVAVTITGTADGHPTAVGDTLFTNSLEGTQLLLHNAWLVRNDTDPTDDPLNVGSAVDGTNVDQVTVDASTTGIRVNVAAGGGGDFSYTATDGALSSDAATVVVSRGLADNAIVGGTGDDILIDGRTDQALTTLDGGLGSDILVGGSLGNALVGDQADLLIDGGAGSDVLQVAGSFDDTSDEQLLRVEIATLAAGGFLDLGQQTEGMVVVAATGAETIATGSGDDTITGAAGADSIDSGAGSDTLVIRAVGGSSSDSAAVRPTGNSNDTGQDRVAGFDLATDTIRIVATNVARFEHGTQTAIGTAGGTNDGTAASFTTSTGLVTMNADLNFTGPADIAITFVSPSAVLTQAAFEARLQYKLTGDSNGNALIGGGLDDVLSGGGGADIIQGGAGADIITGGTAEDNLTGGAGADQFRLQVGTSLADRINDYEDNVDKIGLTGGATFSTIGTAAGTVLNAADFVVRSSFGAMTDADDNKVVLVTAAGITTGQFSFLDAGDNATNTYVIALNDDINRAEIWFDTNWNDGANRVLIGIIENIDNIAELTVLTHTDIVVYTTGLDPIILDLDGNGFAFSGLEDSRVFDLNADGHVDEVAWNVSGDGMLAMDRNGNGRIEDGSELFTPTFGNGEFASGGDALASLDSNGDGLIDASDAAFAELFIWRDLDANGITGADELASLDDWGISSIAVPAAPDDREIDGQAVVGSGSFTWADGSAGEYVEVALDIRLGAAADDLF